VLAVLEPSSGCGPDSDCSIRELEPNEKDSVELIDDEGTDRPSQHIPLAHHR
jgi:hypothetical protein